MEELKPRYRSEKKEFLDRLKDGEIVIGDGGYVFALEKRGYVKAGPWTPEACIEHPEAVRQLAREFGHNGADVMQAFTFYASDDKLENRGNEAKDKYSGATINAAACQIARDVAKEINGLMAGGVSQTPTYLSGAGKEKVQEIFKKQMTVFAAEKVDFMIVEYFEHVEEACWAIEVVKEYGIPIAASLCIGPEGDLHGVSTGECAVKMAEAGADVIGINCHFDPNTCLDAVQLMKDALAEKGLERHLMVQPLGYVTPDCNRQGFIDLPEFPFGLEPRIITRWEAHAFARRAYEMGVRYIGGCCGIEPYHVRAIAEELSKERGFLPMASVKHGLWGAGLKMHTKPWVRARARAEYWKNLKPASGRPYCASMAKPDNWGVTAGADDLKQKKEETSQKELEALFVKAS